MNVQNAQRSSIGYFGVWYYSIYFSRKMVFWSILLYIFSKKIEKKNVGYDFLKLTGVKHPGGETAEGRKVRES